MALSSLIAEPNIALRSLPTQSTHLFDMLTKLRLNVLIKRVERDKLSSPCAGVAELVYAHA